MGDNHKQSVDYQDHHGGISHPIHTSTTCPTPAVCPLPTSNHQGGTLCYRPRSPRITGQEGDRTQPWSWFRFTPFHNPKEDRRSSPRLESQTAESAHQTSIVQDGDYPTGMSAHTTQRIHDFNRPPGRISARTNSFFISSPSPIPVEQHYAPVQVASFWPFSEPIGIHQNTTSSAPLGSQERNPHLGIFRRFDNHRQNQRTDSSTHTTGTPQVDRTGLPLQCVEITPHPDTTPGSSGLQHQHTDHVLVHSTTESTGSTPRCSTLAEDEDMQPAPPLFVHRESTGHHSSRLSSQTAHETTTTAEEPSLSTGPLMDLPRSSHHTSHGRPPLVDPSPQPMEWTLLHSGDSNPGGVHRRLRSGMGHHIQQPHTEGHVDDRGTASTHQLQGVTRHMEAITITSSTGSGTTHLLRQHLSNHLREEFRRDSVSSIDGTGSSHMDLMPAHTDEAPHELHPLQVQPGRRSFQTTIHPNRMVDRQTLRPTTGGSMGATSTRLLCEQHQPPDSTVHQLAMGPTSHDNQRIHDTVDPLETSLPMSTVEPHSSMPTTSTPLSHQSHPHHAQLAERPLVPTDPLDDTGTTSTTPILLDLPGTSRRRSLTEEPDVGTRRLELKRQRLIQQGYDSHALAVFFHPEVRPSHQQYTATQRRFIQWCEEHDENAWSPTPAIIVNYLAYGHHTLKWKVTTCIAYQSAILQLYDTDLRPILQQDPSYQDFLNSLKALTVQTFDKPRFDLAPALAQLRSFGDNQTMSPEQLTQKVCFLLAITGFLRNADIHRINLAKVQLLDNDTKLHLVIDCPKEKRRGSPIERVTVIRQHHDATLCPIKTYKAYTTSRIASIPCVGPHPTRPSRSIDFLVRSLQDFSVSVGTQTIGRHVRSLLALVQVDNPAQSRPLRARAIGSTNSVLHGASVDDILAHGS
ncbi:hypothetical protein [Parasitella parasitica]|uniref:Tyr recombinase domain-containing protein n=1 Tax=Parasitella parasitica TaxID=35722 RepID=A0A0B7MVW1_9FUNG|nr:hypothetical protein [Parasitella parasitica]